MILLNFSIYYSRKNTKTSYKSKKIENSAPRLTDKIELIEGRNSLSDIQHYFEYIIKKHETLTNIRS